MNIFEELYYDILLESNPESRFEFLFNKYKDRFTTPEYAENTIKHIVYEVDPTKGLYSDWIVKNYLNLSMREKTYFEEDSYKIKEDLEKYHKYKKYFKSIGKPEFSDLNRIKASQQENNNGFLVLSRVITLLNDYIEASEEKDLFKKAEKDAEKVYDSENYLILIPKTKEASCAYGRGTRWCTASTGSYNYFDQYNKEGPLYIVIDKQSNQKYQFHFQSSQFMDSEDSPIEDLSNFFDSHKEIEPIMLNLSLQNENSDFVIQVNPDYYISLNKIISDKKLQQKLKDSPLLTFKWGIKESERINKLQNRFIFKPEGVYIKADDMEELSYFINSKDRPTALKILTNENDYYSDYMPDYDDYMWDWLDEKAFESIKNYIAKYYERIVLTVSDAQSFIEEKDDEHIKDLLSRAFGGVINISTQDSLYKAALEPIKSVLGDHKYSKDGSIIFGPYSHYIIEDIFEEINSGAYSTLRDTTLNTFLSNWGGSLEQNGYLENVDFDRAYDNYPDKKEYGQFFNSYVIDNIDY